MRESYLLPVSVTPPPAKFFRLSELRKLRRSEQVAAVCYRVGKRGVDFLLVQTDKGRWTFPKGSAEPGLTHAQAAALEAYEEAGVVDGRMEELAFTSYIRHKDGKVGHSTSSLPRVHAHLCEVLQLDPPLEFKRNPTWFRTDVAKRRLRENRKAVSGNALAQVITDAVTRIRGFVR
jgi:8-oxo-dGTP pyrophosphatase MutT (NUDIX family)